MQRVTSLRARSRSMLTRLIAVLGILAVSACNGAGAPTSSPDATVPATVQGQATTVPTSAVQPSGSPKETEMRNPTPSLPFTLTSPEFADGASIPRRYTCDAENVSPPLSWAGAPAEAVSLALIVDDPDARGWVHWVVFDIPESGSGSLPTGWSTTLDASPQGTNSFGRVGYGGPCPPSGTHHYVFRLLALDAELALNGAPNADQVLAAARGHELAEAKLTGTYKRG